MPPFQRRRSAQTRGFLRVEPNGKASARRPLQASRALPLVQHRFLSGIDVEIHQGHADAGQALVVNPPAAMAANNSKPYQLRLIARHGFEVPATLAVGEFHEVNIIDALGPDLVGESA